MPELYYLFLFITICFLLYLVHRNYDYISLREGIENASNPKSPLFKSPGELADEEVNNYNKISDNMKKQFDISKNRGSYESLILNLDDFINMSMLELIIKIKTQDGLSAAQNNLELLAKMQQSKSALNSVMKFIDSQ